MTLPDRSQSPFSVGASGGNAVFHRTPGGRTRARRLPIQAVVCRTVPGAAGRKTVLSIAGAGPRVPAIVKEGAVTQSFTGRRLAGGAHVLKDLTKQVVTAPPSDTTILYYQRRHHRQPEEHVHIGDFDQTFSHTKKKKKKKKRTSLVRGSLRASTRRMLSVGLWGEGCGIKPGRQSGQNNTGDASRNKPLNKEGTGHFGRRRRSQNSTMTATSPAERRAPRQSRKTNSDSSRHLPPRPPSPQTTMTFLFYFFRIDCGGDDYQ